MCPQSTDDAEVPVLPAATLMPVRDGAAGLEVCLLRRNPNSTWVAGLALFPGGAVDPRDAAPELAARCALPPGVADAADLAGGIAPWIAAVRECFEEIGLLLADDASGAWAADEAGRAGRLHAARRPIDAGEQRLVDLLTRERLRLRLDLLRFVAHWVTPPGQARRYDTRFYVAATPRGAAAHPDGTEIVSAEWLSPAAAIEAHGAGELPMLPPTLGALHWLAPHGSVAAAISAADAMGAIPRWTPGDVRDAEGHVRPGGAGGAGADRPSAGGDAQPRDGAGR